MTSTNIWMWRVPGFFPVCSLATRMEERQTTSRKVMNNVNNRSEVYVSGDRRKAGGTRKIQRQLALSDSPIEPSHGRKLPLIRNSDSWPRQRLSTEQGAELFEKVNFLIHPIHIEFDYEMDLTDYQLLEVTPRAIALQCGLIVLFWYFMCYVSVRYGIAYSSCCCMLFHNVPMDHSSYTTHRLVLLVGNFRCQVYSPGLQRLVCLLFTHPVLFYSKSVLPPSIVIMFPKVSLVFASVLAAAGFANGGSSLSS